MVEDKRLYASLHSVRERSQHRPLRLALRAGNILPSLDFACLHAPQTMPIRTPHHHVFLLAVALDCVLVLLFHCFYPLLLTSEVGFVIQCRNSLDERLPRVRLYRLLRLLLPDWLRPLRFGYRCTFAVDEPLRLLLRLHSLNSRLLPILENSREQIQALPSGLMPPCFPTHQRHWIDPKFRSHLPLRQAKRPPCVCKAFRERTGPR